MNTLTFKQISTVLNDFNRQVTGRGTIEPINTEQFVSVANNLLQYGLDPIINAMSTTLSRTVFSIRPYRAKFRMLQYTPEEWGAHTRKLQIADKELVNDDKYTWPVAWGKTDVPEATPNNTYDNKTTNPSGEKERLDQWLIRKPDIIQTNIYGSSVFSDWITWFAKQIRVSLRGPSEFASYISMIESNWSDRLEQNRETIARGVLLNLIGGILSENQGDRVYHFLTEYNTLTGLNLTKTDVYKPENFRSFILWAASRIDTLSRLMEERSVKFQTSINGKPVMHHTPRRDQEVYLFAPFLSQIATMALSDTFHTQFVNYRATEVVNYWQSIENPDHIDVTPALITNEGTYKVGDTVSVDNVFGVIFDREAAGWGILEQDSFLTPMNARGAYRNTWFHETISSFNDFTEKAIVILLD